MPLGVYEHPEEDRTEVITYQKVAPKWLQQVSKVAEKELLSLGGHSAQCTVTELPKFASSQLTVPPGTIHITCSNDAYHQILLPRQFHSTLEKRQKLATPQEGSFPNIQSQRRQWKRSTLQVEIYWQQHHTIDGKNVIQSLWQLLRQVEAEEKALYKALEKKRILQQNLLDQLVRATKVRHYQQLKRAAEFQ